jgi:hypothetical protein
MSASNGVERVDGAIAIRGWQILAIAGIPLLGLAATWGSTSARLSAVEEQIHRAEDRAESAEAALHAIDVRLTRIQAVLESMRSGDAPR